MEKKLLTGMIVVLALMAFVSAAIFTEPWNTNQNGGQKNLTNVDTITANNFSGNIVWSNLTDYPVACAGSSAITTLGDSVTCSDLWVDVAGDEITGGLNISENLDVTGNITGTQIYGEMWMHNETGYATTMVESSLTWYNITGFSNPNMTTGQTLNGFYYNDTGEYLTALVAGKYHVTFSLSTGNAGNNQEYEFGVTINDIVQNNTVVHRKLGTGGDVGDTSGSGFIDIVINDSLYIRVLNKDGTADLQVHAMNLNLIRLGA